MKYLKYSLLQKDKVYKSGSNSNVIESNMTYILVDKSKAENRSANLLNLLTKLFQKEITEEYITKAPDIHTINPFEKNSIGIEEVKEFQKEMLFKPFQEKIQVGIIYDSEKLTIQAQNALLKSLEESSDSSVYILFVSNEKNLLPTIRSRARVIYSSFEPKVLEKLEENILSKDILEKFEIVDKYAETKDSSFELINEIEDIFREKLELEIKNGNIRNSTEVLESLKVVEDCREKISANCNRKLALESMMVQIKA